MWKKMKNIKVDTKSYFYLGCPYSHEDDSVMHSRYLATSKLMAKLLNKDWILYCPVVSYHPIAVEYGLPREYSFWYKRDRLFLKMASGLIVFMLDGWKESIGLKDEIKIAKEFRLPIIYIPENYDSII